MVKLLGCNQLNRNETPSVFVSLRIQNRSTISTHYTGYLMSVVGTQKISYIYRGDQPLTSLKFEFLVSHISFEQNLLIKK